MESKAKHELLQSKAQWEKLESDMRIDQENNKKLKDGQIEALSRLVVILIKLIMICSCVTYSTRNILFCICYVPLCRYSIYHAFIYVFVSSFF